MSTNITEGAENVKTEQNENGTQASAETELREFIRAYIAEAKELGREPDYEPIRKKAQRMRLDRLSWKRIANEEFDANDSRNAKADSTAMSAKELAKTVIGDPWEWYCSELERVLGKDRAKQWSNMTDEAFETLLIEIKEETWASFPIEALPPVLGDLAKSIAKAHKSEDKIGVIALPLIGVFSGSLGQGIVVKTKHNISYPNLFVYCSVGSGGIKSVVIDEAEAPVIEFQKAQFKRYENETKPEALAELRRIEAQIEEMKDFPDGDDEGGMSGLARLYHRKAEEEKKLEFCPVKLDDFTPEAMVIHGINHGRVFISSDEGGIVADILCGRYSKGFTDDGPMCKIWTSSYLSRKRKDGLIWKDCVTGSMLLMGQEHITEQMFQNENMVTSGFIPRLLFATAETPMLYRDKNRPAICEDARDNYRNVIIYVLEKHWSKTDEAEPITYRHQIVQESEPDHVQPDLCRGIPGRIPTAQVQRTDSALPHR